MSPLEHLTMPDRPKPSPATSAVYSAFDIEYSSAVDTGRARSNNEDAVLVDEALSLCVLADGMGGYNAGEIASDMTVRGVRDQLARWRSDQGTGHTEATLRQGMSAAAQSANLAVFEAAQQHPEYAGMGTTLVLAMFEGQQVWIGHIGDSRAYRWRDGRLEQLTRDHSLLQEQIEPDVVLEVHAHEMRVGDCLLLCSDGLSDMLPDAGIAQVMRAHDTLSGASQALVEAANAAGGRDNIAVILARAKGGTPPASRIWWPFKR
jgi:serine/threonine protein phosphatase PrpC